MSISKDKFIIFDRTLYNLRDQPLTLSTKHNIMMHKYVNINANINLTVCMYILCILETLAISFTPLCQCLSEETLKAVGPFYLVSMPGEVKYPTSLHWKCVTAVDSTTHSNPPPPTCNKPHTLRDAVTGRNRNYQLLILNKSKLFFYNISQFQIQCLHTKFQVWIISIHQLVTYKNNWPVLHHPWFRYAPT